MNIENNIYNAKNCLDHCRAKVESHDYESALAMSAAAYSNCRRLMEHIWELLRAESLAQRSAGG